MGELFAATFEVVKRIVRHILARFSQKVVSNQLRYLKLSLREVEIFLNEDPKIDRMGRLTVFCRNKGDIPFEIKGIGAEVNVKSEGEVPTRGYLNSYPVARFEESKDVMREKNVGYSHTSSTKIENLRSRRNYANIRVEFALPSWLGKVKRIYLDGFLKIQKGLLKKFRLRASEDEISRRS